MTDDLIEFEVIFNGLSADGDQICIVLPDGEERYWGRKYAKNFGSLGSSYSVMGRLTESGGYSLALQTARWIESNDVEDRIRVRHAAGSKAISLQRAAKKAEKKGEEAFGDLTLNQIRDMAYHFGKEEKAALIAKMISVVKLW
jgi:hypothetical protein